MSGGVSSTLAAYYHRKTALSDPIYYFNDTLIEDPDLYRFLIESVYFLTDKKINSKLAKLIRNIPELAPGVTIEQRTHHLNKIFEIVCKQTGLVREYSVDPWQAFLDDGFIGNSRIDICSRKLKRDPRKCFTDKFQCEICLGFDWMEIHRYEKAQQYEPNLIAPMITDLVDKQALWDEFHKASGIRKSRSYDSGFPHDNCGGMCVKAGLGQFRLLWEQRPHVYLWHEERMEYIMSLNPNLRPFLKKQINGETLYLTLKQYREQYLMKGCDLDVLPSGGCGCAI